MKSRTYTQGFTLVETLVALSIFTMSILGIIVITGQGLNDVNFVRNRFVASYFAQEGLETMRNVRDGLILRDTVNGSDDVNGLWTEFGALLRANNCYADQGGGGCFIYVLTDDPMQLEACPTDWGCGFQYNKDTGVYERNDSEPELYRSLVVEEVNENDYLIRCTVTWRQGSVDRSISMTTHLFKWN